MAEVVFLPAAAGDYQQALAWYEGRNAQAAAGFEAAIEVALRVIQQAPESWTLCDERHRFYSLRRFPYNIYYRVEVRNILVVAVAHVSRSETYWRGRG